MKNFNFKILCTSLFLLACAAPAFADCVSSCLLRRGCEFDEEANSTHSSDCAIAGRECKSNCAGPKFFGAIAYNAAAEAYGWSDSWGTKEKAEKHAVEICAERAKDCEPVVTFSHSCGAIAADGDTVTWAQNDSESQAKQLALNDCIGRGKSACAVKISHCSK